MPSFHIDLYSGRGQSEVNQLICNNNKAKELIDWQPKISLVEGLEKTMNWFKANAEKYKSEIYNI